MKPKQKWAACGPLLIGKPEKKAAGLLNVLRQRWKSLRILLVVRFVGSQVVHIGCRIDIASAVT